VTIFLCGNPDFDLNTYPNLTHKRKAFMYRVLKRIEQEMTPSVKDWLHLSIAAGLLGIDEKPVHAATSAIDRSRGIAFDRPDEPEGLAVRRVAEELWDTARTKCRIDAAEAFLLRISCSHRDRISILSFPDDYLETIVLFRYYQELLRKYGGLRIDCVPRSLRCSNDVTYDDAIEFCSDFVELQSSPRFAVHDNGPKIGGVNLMKLHPKILRLIEAATFIDVRGARNFEMMQKINKETYFGFMVCREISEAVTGLRAEERPLVYVRQNPGDSSFDGFEYRHRRKDNRKMFALLTVADRKRQWEGGHLSEYHSWSKVRQERYSILQRFYSGNADVFHDKYGQALESEVREFLGALGGDILVIGCGSGKEVAWLWENGRSVLGIDFSSEAIQLAQREHPEISSQFRMEDFYNLDMVTDHQFNGIVANAAMVHLLERSDLSVMLDKIWAKLTDEGLCFLRMIEKEGFQQEMDRSQREGDRWFVYYTLDELQEACEGHGFVIERHDRRAHTRFAGVHWISLLLRKPSPTNRMDVSSQ
jgi:2-polyprenyl-3-methyl-5-hydroxy-6-metoxy-1,4-benzoquinol methylase